MKEFKGTKGKWDYLKSNTGGYVIIVDNNYTGSFKQEADAKLIAKAPIMLEMIIDILEQENISQSAYYEINKLLKEIL